MRLTAAFGDDLFADLLGDEGGDCFLRAGSKVLFPRLTGGDG